jgi:hypothetical protein
MVIKELSQQDARYFVIKALADLYDYFGINQPDERTFLSQADQLIDDLYIYPSITQEQFTEAIKMGRREAQDIIKPSVKNIMNWISQYLIRFKKAEAQNIHQTSMEKKDIKYSSDQKKAWVISSFRQYNEERRDMSKFFDFGSITYKTIYDFLGYELSKKQVDWCLNEAKKAEQSIFHSFVYNPKSDDPIASNATASAYACKLFFDQFKSEEEIRTRISFFKPVDKDHWIASMQYTPWAIEYKRPSSASIWKDQNNEDAMTTKDIFE